MRPPIQVWCSYFWKSPFDEKHARDFSRAQRAWQGELRAYLDKDAKEVTRWQGNDQGMLLNECVVPSETVNCFTITHVDGQGQVYPFIPLPDAWHGSVSGSYARWIGEKAHIYLIQSEFRKMPTPLIKDGEVSIIDAQVQIQPGPVTPHVTCDDNGVMDVGYMRAGNAEMLDPNHEVETITGKAHYERRKFDGQELLVAVSNKDPKLCGISTELGFKKPFSYLFGEGAGIDLAMHQATLKECIKDLQAGRTGKAFKEAETWVGKLTSPGKTTIWHSWFAPRAMANKEGALIDVEFRYHISANSIEELHQSKEFQQIMKTNVEITVAHDWLGYMWWDFYQDLKDNITVRCCEACGGVIRGGRQDRRYCSQEENTECFRKRTANRQRKKRRH